MARYRTIQKHAEETGYSEHAIRSKIQRGFWMEGRVWRRAPDGRVLIDEDGYNEWVENGNGLLVIPSHRKNRGEMRSSDASPAPLIESGHS